MRSDLEGLLPKGVTYWGNWAGELWLTDASDQFLGGIGGLIRSCAWLASAR
jgi:hypothetical protein